MEYIEGQFRARYGATQGEVIYKKLSNSKRHARGRGIEVDLQWEDIDLLAKPLLGEGLCDYTGQPFGEDDMKPSIERIDADKGYVRGNICIVTMRANMAKNYLYDMPDTPSKFNPELKETVRQMMDYCTGEHMERLKKKYVPQGCKNNEDEENKLEKHEIDIIQKYGQQESTEPCIHEDIGLAEKYSSWLRFMIKNGYDVTLSFSEFKVLVKAKRCFITGKELKDTAILPVIFDKKGKVERGNVRFASEAAANALNNLVDKSGMTVQELISNLKKIVK